MPEPIAPAKCSRLCMETSGLAEADFHRTKAESNQEKPPNLE